MKNFYILLAISLLISITIHDCDKYEESIYKAPTCTITCPDNNDEIAQGDTVTISVELDDADGIVTEVRLFIDSTIVALFFNFPYSYQWDTECEKTGSHLIKAVLRDKDSISSVDEIAVILTERSEAGIITDYDGNTYKILKIGDQWWMTENLKTEHYADGSEINLVESNEVWDALCFDDKAFCYLNNNAHDEADIYGALYTWAAAMNGQNSSDLNPSGVQGICPTGWHLPSDKEWKQLEMYLGMNKYEVDETGWRGTDEGAKLKDRCTGLFGYYTGATNESGFTALPAGHHHNQGYSDAGTDAYFWSSAQYEVSHAWYRQLNIDVEAVFRYDAPKSFGYSVRCVRD